MLTVTMIQLQLFQFAVFVTLIVIVMIPGSDRSD